MNWNNLSNGQDIEKCLECFWKNSFPSEKRKKGYQKVLRLEQPLREN